ncbi:hypothetical protein MY10362_006711 [Beauveria mimosiformis]
MQSLIELKYNITDMIEDKMSILRGDYNRHMEDFRWANEKEKQRLLKDAEHAADRALLIIALRRRDWPREAEFRRLRAIVYILQDRQHKADADKARAEEVEKKIEEREEAGEVLVKDVKPRYT